MSEDPTQPLAGAEGGADPARAFHPRSLSERTSSSKPAAPATSARSGKEAPATFATGGKDRAKDTTDEKDASEGELEAIEHASHKQTVNLVSRPLPASDLAAFHQAAYTAAAHTLIGTAVAALGAASLPLRASVRLVLGGVVIFVGQHWLRTRISNLHDDFHADAERRRARDATGELQSFGESSEWLNQIVATLWPRINSELFGIVLDLLEDVMISISPGIVSSVRVEDLDLGSNPMRIVSFRQLPDSVPIGGETGGSDDHFNIECTFAYRRAPGTHTENIHCLVHMGIGHSTSPRRSDLTPSEKLASVELPVFVEVGGVVGVRAGARDDG